MVTAMSGCSADILILAMHADTGISDQSVTATFNLRTSSSRSTISATTARFPSSGKTSGWIAYTALPNPAATGNHATLHRADWPSMQRSNASNRKTTMARKLRMGMVGGGRDAFIGAVHRMAASFCGKIDLVAGAFSANAEKSRLSGEDLGLDPKRVYPNYETMAKT